MAKITYEFDSTEDEYGIISLFHAKSMRSALWQIQNLAHDALKYEKDFKSSLLEISEIAREYNE